MTMICHSLHCFRKRFVLGKVKDEQVIPGWCGARTAGLRVRKFEVTAMDWDCR